MSITSPALESNLAKRRAEAFFKATKRNRLHHISRKQFYHTIMKDKVVNAKNIKKLLRLAKVKCPSSRRICAQSSNSFYVETIDTDDGFMVGLRDKEYDDIDWAYSQSIITLEIFAFCKGEKVIKTLLVGTHALKRLFERFPEYRLKTDDEVIICLLDWLYTIDVPEQSNKFKTRCVEDGITAVGETIVYEKNLTNMIKTFYHISDMKWDK